VTDAAGRAYAVVAPTGTPGTAVVRAAVPGGKLSAVFALTADIPAYLVRLTDYSFVSAQNGSTNPAVDTIPAGTRMVWLLTPFDYDSHRVISTGSPAFPNTPDFPYSGQSTVSVTFTTPGRYDYADFYFPTKTGIVVVK
jgi:plastocyanin